MKKTAVEIKNQDYLDFLEGLKDKSVALLFAFNRNTNVIA